MREYRAVFTVSVDALELEYYGNDDEAFEAWQSSADLDEIFELHQSAIADEIEPEALQGECVSYVELDLHDVGLDDVALHVHFSVELDYFGEV